MWQTDEDRTSKREAQGLRVITCSGLFGFDVSAASHPHAAKPKSHLPSTFVNPIPL